MQNLDIDVALIQEPHPKIQHLDSSYISDRFEVIHNLKNKNDMFASAIIVNKELKPVKTKFLNYQNHTVTTTISCCNCELFSFLCTADHQTTIS